MIASFASQFSITFLSLPEITQAFVISIAVMTGLMVGPFYNNRTLAYGPTILTMAGIFGCFLGISLGLMEFKTNDIQGSVPSLVDGIRTAFWASVSGVGGALLIKIRLLVFGPPRISSEGAVEEATVDDLAALLQNLHRSLAGSEDSTLLSQTKLLRQESRDGLASLKSSLDGYMEKIAESNSKALIEALKEVIRDFNAKINEQFGDNFKQLNAAVEKLVVWQQTYRLQMSEMIDQQKTISSTMSDATRHYTEMVKQTETFSTAANSLSSLIETLSLQRDQISASISSLGTLLKSAGDNLPKIESHVGEMTRQIETSVRANQEQMASSVKAITQSLQTSHSEMKKLLVDVTEGVNKDVNAHMKQLSENTRSQVVALDKALSDELTKSISTLGRHLTALSQRFVEDYRPLTESLRSLVRAAERN